VRVTWGAILEDLQPLATDLAFKIGEAGNVAAGSRQNLDETAADRIGDLGEDRRYRSVHSAQRGHEDIAVGDDEVGRELYRFLGIGAYAFDIDAETIFKANITTFSPTELTQPLHQRIDATSGLWVGFRCANEDADTPDPLRLLLRARRDRPRRRAAEERDELAAADPWCPGRGAARSEARRCARDTRDEVAPAHSITSSARASKVGGTSTPSALAVFWLIARYNVVGAWNGRSAGAVPRKIRST